MREDHNQIPGSRHTYCVLICTRPLSYTSSLLLHADLRYLVLICTPAQIYPKAVDAHTLGLSCLKSRRWASRCLNIWSDNKEAELLYGVLKYCVHIDHYFLPGMDFAEKNKALPPRFGISGCCQFLIAVWPLKLVLISEDDQWIQFGICPWYCQTWEITIFHQFVASHTVYEMFHI